MTLTVVKEVPKRARKKTLIGGYLDEFMRMNVKVVKVDFNEKEYKSAKNCQAAFLNACKRGAYPIKVQIINDKVYLIRKDMD